MLHRRQAVRGPGLFGAFRPISSQCRPLLRKSGGWSHLRNRDVKPRVTALHAILIVSLMDSEVAGGHGWFGTDLDIKVTRVIGVELHTRGVSRRYVQGHLLVRSDAVKQRETACQGGTGIPSQLPAARFYLLEDE